MAIEVANHDPELAGAESILAHVSACIRCFPRRREQASLLADFLQVRKRLTFKQASVVVAEKAPCAHQPYESSSGIHPRLDEEGVTTENLLTGSMLLSALRRGYAEAVRQKRVPTIQGIPKFPELTVDRPLLLTRAAARWALEGLQHQSQAGASTYERVAEDLEAALASSLELHQGHVAEANLPITT